jgi:hypothetical protein
MDPSILQGLFELLLCILFGFLVGAGALGLLFLAMLPATWFVLVLEDQQDRERHRKHTQLLALGMSDTEEGYRGNLDGWPLRYHPSSGWGAEVAVGTLVVYHEGLCAAGSDTRTGDPAFDQRFTVWGDMTDVARLTAPVRAQLLYLLRERPQTPLRIEGGCVWVASPRLHPLDRALAIEVARLLSRGLSDPYKRLQHMATQDPSPLVRKQALGAVARQHPELVQDLAALLLRDADPVVRAHAALVLRAPGELCWVATQRGLPRELRWSAATTLLDVGDPAQRLWVGERLAREGALGAGAAGLERQGVTLLQSVGPQGESALLSLLPVADGELLRYVVAVLGEVGSIAAVPALRARQAELSLLQNGLLAAIDHAIQKIQAASGGEPGRLALAGSPGALSLAPGSLAERGALSEAPPTQG